MEKKKGKKCLYFAFATWVKSLDIKNTCWDFMVPVT